MGIEGIDILKKEREGVWNQSTGPRAFVFVPDSSSSTCADAALRFRKHVGLRSMGFYTAGGDWTYGINPRPRDMLCFYGPLKLRGRPLEDVFLELVARKKQMLVLEAKDCYEIMEAR